MTTVADSDGRPSLFAAAPMDISMEVDAANAADDRALQRRGDAAFAELQVQRLPAPNHTRHLKDLLSVTVTCLAPLQFLHLQMQERVLSSVADSVGWGWRSRR